MAENNRIDLYGNIRVPKIAILKLIHNNGGRNEIWVGDLKKVLLGLNPDIKEQLGLNYKKNSIYKILDRMADKNLIEKYQKLERNVYSYVKISEFGLDILRKYEILVRKNKIERIQIQNNGYLTDLDEQNIP